MMGIDPKLIRGENFLTPEQVKTIVPVDRYMDGFCPDNEEKWNGISPGTMYEYASSTYVNGFLNYYSNIVGGYMIRRYTAYLPAIRIVGDPPNVRAIKDPPSDEECVKEWNDSVALIDKWNTEGVIHTKLGELHDDVLLLSNIDDSTYGFFWLDHDVSDCLIGRFEKDKYENDDDALAGLWKYAMTVVANHIYDIFKYDALYKDAMYYNIPASQFIKYISPNVLSGWISF